jgi:hypothetical protein
MDVVVSHVRQLEVHDDGQRVDVQPARRDIRRH